MKRPGLLYVSPGLLTFVKNDIRILSKNYKVEHNYYNWRNKKFTPIFMLRQLFYLIVKINSFNVILITFGGYWALIPSVLGKICGKNVFIILNGTDSSDFKEIGYGTLRKPLIRICNRISYGLCTKLLPVSESLIYTENTYYSDKTIIQGVKYFYPKLRTPFQVVFNGLDYNYWNNEVGVEKIDTQFITVLSKGQFIRKGCELILEVSRYFTGCRFIIAGIEKPDFISEDFANVCFTGKLKPEELLREYRNSRFYLQLSIFEGFGYALCEAMLCECIPIGSNVNFIPGIIGDSGYVLKKRDANLLSEILGNALNDKQKDAVGRKARHRIIENFSNQIREETLKSIFAKSDEGN